MKVMNLTDQAISDLQQITGNSNEFGVAITLTAPNGTSAAVTGFHVKTHLAVDAEGNQVSSRRASVAISERAITNANGHYPIRDGEGDVNMKNHLVDVADSSQATKNYIVKDCMPDEKLGLILLILEDYEE